MKDLNMKELGFKDLNTALNAFQNASVRNSKKYAETYAFKTFEDVEYFFHVNKFTPRSVMFLNNKDFDKNGQHKGFEVVVVSARLRRLVPENAVQVLVKILCENAIANAFAASNKFIDALGYTPKTRLFSDLCRCIGFAIVGIDGKVDASKIAINQDAVRFGKICSSLFRYEYNKGVGVNFSHKLTATIHATNERGEKLDENGRELLHNVACGVLACFGFETATTAKSVAGVDMEYYDCSAERQTQARLKAQKAFTAYDGILK